jgi:hypothetical protein
MKIIHTVQFAPSEVDALFEIARKAGEISESTAYGVEEKQKKVADAIDEFAALLSNYGHEVFCHGKTTGYAAAVHK